MQWGQGDVSEELSRCGGGQIERGPVEVPEVTDLAGPGGVDELLIQALPDNKITIKKLFSLARMQGFTSLMVAAVLISTAFQNSPFLT